MTKTYATPQAFRHALETRLRNLGGSIERRRQLLVFDRLLARIDHVFGDAATLKGGLVLEIRLATARTTKDVDLRLMGDATDTLDKLRTAGALDVGDHFIFDIDDDAKHPTIRNPGVRYEGRRFVARASVAGKLYGQPFGVDVAFGDPISGVPEVVIGDNVLDFAGVAPATIRLYPIETHLAEKLHAFTLPRERENTRVKDLPDIALLATIRSLDAVRLRAAIEQTFAFRNTHAVPESLPRPPTSWEKPYARLASMNALQWVNLDQAFAAAASFIDLVLRKEEGVWSPATWSWRPGGAL